MDPELGLVVYPDEQTSDFSFFKPYSEATAIKIDEKVKEYLDNAYKVAKTTILEHKDTIEQIAEILIKKEYISGEDFSMMVEYPEKIEEFKSSDELLTNIEEKSGSKKSDNKQGKITKKTDSNSKTMKKTTSNKKKSSIKKE